MAGFDLNLNKVPPTPVEEVQNTETQLPETPEVEVSSTPQEQVETPPQPQTQVDTFFDDFNKRFGTQFKGEDDLKTVLGLQKTVDEYKTQLQDREALVKSAEEYKRRISELEEVQDPLKDFINPEVYIAARIEDQLRTKYPKGNQNLLREIATRDVDSMDDLDVLVKEKQLFVPNPPKESNLRAIVLKKYNVDSSLPPEEWDELVRDEIKLDASAARDRINDLKKNIEIPKILTKEQRAQMEAEALSKRERDLAPHREEFNKFDKFSHEGFEFDVPSDFKNSLSDMFNAMFVNAGMELNQENIEYAKRLRDAFLLYDNFSKIREILAKEEKTNVQLKTDEVLNNTQPPNTKTADEVTGNANPLPGLKDFLSSQGLR